MPPGAEENLQSTLRKIAFTAPREKFATILSMLLFAYQLNLASSRIRLAALGPLASRRDEGLKTCVRSAKGHLNDVAAAASGKEGKRAGPRQE